MNISIDMTNKEAIKILDKQKNDKSLNVFDRKAYDMAIKALAQEPCEDAVSRQAVLDEVRAIATWHSGDAFNEDRVITHMKMLSSVTPKREQGEWIQKEYWSEGCGMGETYGYYYECSKCGNLKKGDYKRCGLNYCPNCGAEMR